MEKEKSVKFSIRIPADVHEFLAREAAANERTVTGQIVYLARRAMDRQGVEARVAGGGGVVRNARLP